MIRITGSDLRPIEEHLDLCLRTRPVVSEQIRRWLVEQIAISAVRTITQAKEHTDGPLERDKQSRGQ